MSSGRAALVTAGVLLSVAGVVTLGWNAMDVASIAHDGGPAALVASLLWLVLLVTGLVVAAWGLPGRPGATGRGTTSSALASVALVVLAVALVVQQVTAIFIPSIMVVADLSAFAVRVILLGVSGAVFVLVLLAAIAVAVAGGVGGFARFVLLFVAASILLSVVASVTESGPLLAAIRLLVPLAWIVVGVSWALARPAPSSLVTTPRGYLAE